MPTLLRARDLYPIERPDATIVDTIAAVRAFDPPTNPEIVLLTPAQVLELVSGKLIAYTTPGGDTILLAYDE